MNPARILFDSSLSHTASPSGCTFPAQPQVTSQTEPQPDVGEDRLSFSAPLDDKTREEAIQLAGRLFLKHWSLWEATGCFAARGDADRALMLQNRLIVGRSAPARSVNGD